MSHKKLLKEAYLDGANKLYDISHNRNSWTFDGKAEFEHWYKSNNIKIPTHLVMVDN